VLVSHIQKTQALERLRNSRKDKDKSGHSPSPSTTQPPAASTSSGKWQPPTQSRDATQPSRYFSNAPTPTETILAPDSSPLKPSPQSSSYRPYSAPIPRDVATTQSSGRSLTQFDPLTAPTKYTNGNHALYSPPASSIARDDPRSDDGPPRKRQNRGQSPTSTNAPESSRDAITQQRPNGSKPWEVVSSSKRAQQAPVSSSNSPDSPMNRKEAAPIPKPISQNDPTKDPAFNKFKMVNPLQSPERVKAAWIKAQGNAGIATRLLDDTSWDHRAIPRPPQSTGKANGTNDHNRVQRAREKELGKKSMIYANRAVLESKVATSTTTVPSTPPAKSDVLDLTASSPAASPAVAVPKRKRIPKVVSESEESGLEQSEDEAEPQSKRSRLDSDSLQVLNYFNNRNAESLQELTGKHTFYLVYCNVHQALL
jgi:SWI/SNF-related matrix-associated actin-dependent regulator of chromatin subfamily A containing DEAD/H box 1